MNKHKKYIIDQLSNNFLKMPKNYMDYYLTHGAFVQTYRGKFQKQIVFEYNKDLVIPDKHPILILSLAENKFMYRRIGSILRSRCNKFHFIEPEIFQKMNFMANFV